MAKQNDGSYQENDRSVLFAPRGRFLLRWLSSDELMGAEMEALCCKWTQSIGMILGFLTSRVRLGRKQCVKGSPQPQYSLYRLLPEGKSSSHSESVTCACNGCMYCKNVPEST